MYFSFNNFQGLVYSTGTYEVFPQSSLYSVLFEEVCVNLNIVDYCLFPFDVVCGKNYAQFDTNIYINFLKYFPAGSPGKTILHYAQFANYRKFQQFDYQNEKENIEHYGTLQPPQYNLANIKSPMIIFYCLKNDPLSTFEDVAEIVKRISSKVIVEQVSDEDFNHINFVTARDVKKILNDRVIQYLDQFAKGKIIF
ncbi:lipase 1-like [Aphidius gifuensis]|uniref:lipase 1-like n=1 Tax=Aphidius gifuensis TaxID=684658 RepID=UPI001CDBBF3A|nr:lipase 1-like [Aphidius gifuensis]